MSHDFVRNYRDIKIEPNSYDMTSGIPRQGSLFTQYSDLDIMTETVLMEKEMELFEQLPDKLKWAIDETGESGGESEDYVYNDDRLSFIHIPDPGRITNENSMISHFRSELAQMLFLLENGLTLDQVRILSWNDSDMEFAVKLQFLRDNNIDIDGLDKKSKPLAVIKYEIDKE